MKQRISILGCGWLGMELASGLIQKGYKIKGSSTSNKKFNIFKSIGIKPFRVDISYRDIDISDFLLSDVLIIAIPSKNKYDYINLISRIETSNIRKVIFISSTSVYLKTNEIVNEKTLTKNNSLSEIELLFKSNVVFKSTIIRFGGLFGYDRKPGNFIKSSKKIDNPEGYINFIHRDDCCLIIEKIIEKNIWNKILNACADSHPKRRDFYKREMKKLGKTKPVFNEDSLNDYKIVSNDKLKILLDYKFKHGNL